ncbi:hypothetical protein TrLO_g4880 [Triparma laevis f. longispina]|uniref:Uncharacterized protein n=1 Tax=Triparma laevis f. longispina TaxID=1714387 RepID=A0A9W7FLQ3_9STRA|nr:hypothetical protein TrLO_g4880 [Triparma laevis f. longispina]
MTRLPTIPRSQSGNSRTHCTDRTEHFTNDCTFTINIHESLHDFKNKLMGFDKMERRSGIQIESIEKIGDEETIVKWVVEGTKSCEFYLRSKIITPTQPASPDSPIKIAIESTELLTNHGFKSPSTSNRTVLAKIRDGLITLTPSPYSTTTFTFTFSLSVSSKTLKAKQLPTTLSSLFYDSFKNEDLIDSRMKIAFVKGISSAKKLSSKEDSMIKSNIERIKELSKAKRIPGTVNDTVEKYLHRDSAKNGAAWGMTIARIDCSGETLMSEVLMLDTFAKKRGGRGERKIWRELDGSRSMQFSSTVKLPGGFKERLIELWVTWDVLTDPQGCKTYVTANSPMLEYSGPTHHKFPNSEKMVLADCRGFDIIKPLSENTCVWTRVQQVDLKISVLPKSFFDIVARHELGYSNEVQEKYRRNEAVVDRERLDALAEKMRLRRNQPLLPDQKPVFERCMELFGDGSKDKSSYGWKSLESNSKEVVMSLKFFPPKEGERTIVTGKAIGVVDCSAEEAAAWVMDYCSNERMGIHREQGHPARVKVRGEDFDRENEATYATVKQHPYPLNSREVVARLIWKSEEGRVWVPFDARPRTVKVDYGVKLKQVRGYSKGMWLLENIPSKGAAQCRVTLVQLLDAGGWVPAFVVNAQTKRSVLKPVQQIIARFRQDELVDSFSMKERAEEMRRIWADEVYTAEELSLIERMKEKFEFENNKPWKKLKSSDTFMKMEWINEEGGSSVIGRASTTVDATIFECSSWEFDKMARHYMKSDYDEGSCIGRSIVKLNGHCDLCYYAIELGRGFSPREWLAKRVWKFMNKNVLFVGYEDVYDERFPIGGTNKNCVRGSSFAFLKYERLFEVDDIPQTKVTYCQQADLKGSIPKFVMNNKMQCTLKYLSTMRKKFDQSMDVDARHRSEVVKKIKDKMYSKKELGEEVVRKFEELFDMKCGERPSRSLGMTDNLVHADIMGSHAQGKATVKLECLTEAEARQIGKNFVPALMTEQLAQAGIYEWKATNRAVKELMAEYDWFEPMGLVIGKGIVKTAAWGLMARVFLGALLSMSDLATDLLVLREFWEGGEEMRVYRNLAAGSLIISVFLQFLLALVQNLKRPIGSILKEVFIAAVGLKPPWDAFRVASGYEQNNKALLDPITELTMGKGIEMFTESIPSILIQLSAIVSKIENGTEVNLTSIISLAISLMTTGFVSATLSYDMDTDPRRRSFNPEFYGYVPDSGKKRASLLFALMNLSACQVLLKSMLVVALEQISMSYGLIYIFADMMVYLTQKVLRRDYTFWVPVTGVMGVLVSFLFRVIAKFIADFTGCVHFRHPYEVGGLYFSLNFLSPLMGMTVLLVLQDAGDFGFKAFEKDTTLTYMKTATIIAGSVLILMAGLFFLMMDKSYRPTYFSTETGWQMTRRMFMEGNDAMKAEVFDTNTLHWEPIRAHVEDWVRNGWHEWKDHRPDWFTDHWITLVPLEMIPEEEAIDIDTDGNVGGGGERRQLLATAVEEMLFRVGQGGSKKRHSIVVMPVNGLKKAKTVDVSEFKKTLNRRGSFIY